ncbi:MAG: hypothetical protein IKP54_06885 [Bacteroidales bacterium]|nr:hypothetical protein [Bacteroidales bacterium]
MPKAWHAPSGAINTIQATALRSVVLTQAKHSTVQHIPVINHAGMPKAWHAPSGAINTIQATALRSVV